MLGMNIDELYTLTPRELHNKMRGYADNQQQIIEQQERLHWEAHRFTSTVIANANSKRTIKSRQLAVFPWEKKAKKKRATLTETEATQIGERYKALGVV